MDTTIRQANRDDIPALVAVIGTAFKKVADRLGLPPDKDSKHASNITDSWIAGDMDKGVRYFIARGRRHARRRRDGGARPARCLLYRQALGAAGLSRAGGWAKSFSRLRSTRPPKTGASYISVGVISDEEHLVEWYGRMGFTVNRRIRFEHFTFEVTLMRKELRGK